jgi:uncharacterized protein YqeY
MKSRSITIKSTKNNWELKKLYIKTVIESTEEYHKYNNTRKLYHINQFKKGDQHKFNTIRNKKELTMNTKDRVEIWKEYFDKLLNKEEPKKLIKIGKTEINEVEVEELTVKDVKKAMRNLKKHKAAGIDGILLELIKYGGNKLLNRIYEPVRQIWEEERIPEEWEETKIIFWFFYPRCVLTYPPPNNNTSYIEKRR